MSKEQIITSLESQVDSGTFFKVLSKLIAIPTESQKPTSKPYLYQYFCINLDSAVGKL